MTIPCTLFPIVGKSSIGERKIMSLFYMHVHTCKQMCLFFIKCIHMKPKRMQYNKKNPIFFRKLSADRNIRTSI